VPGSGLIDRPSRWPPASRRHHQPAAIAARQASKIVKYRGARAGKLMVEIGLELRAQRLAGERAVMWVIS